MNFVLKNLSWQKEPSIIQALGEGKKKKQSWVSTVGRYAPSQRTIQASYSEKGQPHYFETNKSSVVLRDSLGWLWQTLSSNPAIKTSTVEPALKA